MDKQVVIALIDYIQQLHKGRLDKSLYAFYEEQLNNCSPLEVNIAIDNLIIRYGHVENLESTIARFIRAASIGLDRHDKPLYSSDSIFSVLSSENRILEKRFADLKSLYMENLKSLRENDKPAKDLFLQKLKELEVLKTHYHKLQYGVFSALEALDTPAFCVKLMWHLEDTVLAKLNSSQELLKEESWPFDRFNKIYGQMYFLMGSLLYREERILYPMAAQMLSPQIQNDLLTETLSYGIISD